MQSKSVIISAGGIGKRMGAEIPKQFLILKGKPIIFWTIEKFYQYDSSIEIIVVLPEYHVPLWESLCQKYVFTLNYKIALGGDERFHSIKNGLAECTGELIAVHDAVRPLVSIEVIAACFENAKYNLACIPVVSVKESIRKIEKEKSYTVNREDYKIVQTPQCFDGNILRKAYRQNYSKLFTDDASVVEADGAKIYMIDGNDENIKITTPTDLLIAEQLIN